MQNLRKRSTGGKIIYLNFLLLLTFIYTGASLTGWGITVGKTPSGGRWDENEITHINVLELKAIQFGVLTYCKDKNFKHVRIMSGSTTAISYINKKRGLKSNESNKTAKEIWISLMENTAWEVYFKYTLFVLQTLEVQQNYALSELPKKKYK